MAASLLLFSNSSLSSPVALPSSYLSSKLTITKNRRQVIVRTAQGLGNLTAELASSTSPTPFNMHFLLIGATGRVGSAVLSEALSRGHTATALVRDPSKIEAQSGLTLSQGSSTNSVDVDKAFDAVAGKKVDAVLVTLNLPREGTGMFAKVVGSGDLMEHSVTHISAAMRKHDVRKLVTLTAAGVGDSFQNMPWLIKSMVHHTLLSAQFKDHENAHKVVREDENVDWVFVRPMRLTEGARTKLQEHGNQGHGVSSFSSCKITNVADFMVTAAETSTWDRQTPVITSV